MKFRVFVLTVLIFWNPSLNAMSMGAGVAAQLNSNDIKLKELNQHSLDLRKIAKEAALELKDEEKSILGDLRLLWQHAVENSETIKFAIYKLSDPDGEKEKDDKKIKKLLKPIANIVPFAAATVASPVASGSTMVGGNVLRGMLSEDSYNKKLEKVTDADLVILAKAIEDLQNELVINYYEYISAKKILALSDKNFQNRERFWENAKYASDKCTVIADTFYRKALEKQQKAQENLLLKRAALEQLVGNEAILAIENKQTSLK